MPVVWFKNVDIHGVNLVTQDRISKREKILWYMLVAVGALVAFVQCIVTVNEFLIASTITKVSFIPLAAIQLPELALCSSYPWNVPKLLEAGFDQPLLYDLIMRNVHGKFDPPLPKSNMSRSQKLKYFHEFSPGSRDLFLNFSLRCEDTVMYCAMAGIPVDCCGSPDALVRPFLHHTYGTCLIFGNLANQTSIEEDAGLTVALRMGPEFRRGMENIGADYLFETFYLELSKDYFFSTGDISLASLGMLTYVKIFAVHITRSASGFGSQCDVQMRPGSRAVSCGQLCMAEAVEGLCKCKAHGFLLKNLSDSFCSPMRLEFCRNQSASELLGKAARCSQKCSLVPCDEWTYHTASSSARLTPNAVRRFRLNNETLSLDNLAMISIRHNQMGYRMECEVPKMSLSDMVAFIGGILGLWMGCSIITLVEILAICVQKVWRLKRGTFRSGGILHRVPPEVDKNGVITGEHTKLETVIEPHKYH